MFYLHSFPLGTRLTCSTRTGPAPWSPSPLPATAVCQGSSSACAAVSSHCTTISTLRMKKLALKLVVMKEAMRMLRFSFKAGSFERSNENVRFSFKADSNEGSNENVKV